MIFVPSSASRPNFNSPDADASRNTSTNSFSNAATCRAYLGTTPSRKKVQKLCESISDMTGRNLTLLDTTVIVERLNRKLRGWANYFRLGPVSKAYRAVDSHVTNRLRQWLCAKHKTSGRGTTRFPDDYLYQTLGLIRLPVQTRNFPWATRLNNTR